MAEKKLTPLKAIRAKCVDCCAGSFKEVALCTAVNCPLFLYRHGKNPSRAGIGNHNAFSKPAEN